MESAPPKTEESPQNTNEGSKNEPVSELTKDIQGLSLEESKASEKNDSENKSSPGSPEKTPSIESPTKVPSDSEGDNKDLQGDQKAEFKFTSQNSPNLFFYMGKITSKPKGTYIEDMHKNWWGDYDELEDNHSYIQWLFPNFYRSNFNSSAYELEKHEAIEFIENPELANKLIKSYELILDFYGMRLTDHTTGALARTGRYQSRYKDALLTYFHNHLRIRRILTHLNNVGFRRYAVKLVDFLEKEIYGEVGGYKKYTKKDKTFNTQAFEAAPLKKLAKMKNVFETWALYGNHYGEPERIALLEKNCFCKYPEDFKESVFFRQTSA